MRGQEAVYYLGRLYHPECHAAELGVKYDPSTATPRVTAAPEAETAVTVSSPTQPAEQGSAGACIAVGALLTAIGWFLLLNPEAPDSSLELLGGQGVVNLQLLTIGQTFSIMGAIFLAVGIRPRR